MSEYRRYCLTLTAVDQSQRDKFRKLSRPDTFIEIWPNRVTGERGAYSVEMTEAEYREALRDAESPFSNLLVIEPAVDGGPRPSVPGSAALTYVAAQEADSLGLTGQGVVVGCADTGVSSEVQASVFAGRIKAKRGFGVYFEGGESGGAVVGPMNPNDDIRLSGHGTRMSGLAVPSQAHIAIAAAQNNDVHKSAAIHWLAEEVGVDVILVETQLLDTTVLRDAVNSALAKNIIVVAPNGNGGEVNDGGPGENIRLYPAGYSGVLAISNYLSSTDSISPSSNYGSHTFAAAPSDVNAYTLERSETFLADGGTSAASAMAAGIVARFLSGNVSPGNVKSYLASTARRTGASPVYEGHGVLQLSAAYNKLKDDEAPPSNTDGSIPLPNGGRVRLPALTGSYVDPNLPSNTTVYPTSPVSYSGTGDFVLPDGGYAQLDSATTPPTGWPGTGNLPLSSNSEVTGVSPDGSAGCGYCPGGPCDDGSMPAGGECEGGSGTSGRYCLLYGNYDGTNVGWQTVRDCLLATGSWTDSATGVCSPSGFEGFYGTGPENGDVTAECIDLLISVAGWSESGDKLVPPGSWQQ